MKLLAVILLAVLGGCALPGSPQHTYTASDEDFNSQSTRTLCEIVWKQDSSRARQELVRRGFPENLTKEQAIHCFHFAPISVQITYKELYRGKPS